MSVLAVGAAFAVMLALMLLGLPIAAVMAAVGVGGGVLAFGWPLVDSMGPVMWGVMNENLLTAIPLFILLGELMLRSGMADRMYGAMSLWLGRLPGGLLHTNIGCSALFAATSGSSVATAATIGTVANPALEARGYDRARSLGSIAAGGTLGILIPPSVNLLIYGSLSETSIGQLFVAGIVPGLLLTACFMLWIAFASRGEERPERTAVTREQKVAALLALLPPAIVFLVVMGSIYLGIATPTESAALGVVAALILAGLNGSLSVAFFERCFVQTARTTGMVLLIVLCAFLLNLTLSLSGRGTGGDRRGSPRSASARLGSAAAPDRLLRAARHGHGRAVDDGADDPDRRAGGRRGRRRSGVVRHLRHPHVRARHGHPRPSA